MHKTKSHYVLVLILGLFQNILLENVLIASEPDQKTGFVTASSLNVRSGPSTEHGIITQLSKSNPVQIMGEKGGWLSVDLSLDIEAWIPKSYLSFDNKIANETQVYTGPGDLFKSYSKLQPGEEVTVLATGKNEKWVQVKPNSGILGWVSAKYIKLERENSPPTIKSIQNITLHEDSKSNRIPLIVDESDNADEDNQVLSITVKSSDEGIIPIGNIKVEFEDSELDSPDGWLEIIPGSNKNGACKITIIVDDGFMTVSTAFIVSVLPINDIPVISEIFDQTTVEDRRVSDIIFTVNEGGGSDEDIQELTVKAISSNQRLISDENVIIDFFDDHTGSIGGTISLIPTKDEVGESTITISVADEEFTAGTSFRCSITPNNDPPTISGIPNDIKLTRYDLKSIIKFTVDEGGGADEDSQVLVIRAESSNQLIISDDNIKINFRDDTSDALDGSIQFIPSERVFGKTTVTLWVSDNISETKTSFVVETSESEKLVPVKNVEEKKQLATKQHVTKPLFPAWAAHRLKSDLFQIGSQFTYLETKEDVGLKGIPFRIDFIPASDTFKNEISFSVSSSNTKLLADSNVKIELTETDRSNSSGLIDILPNKDKIGKAQISIVAGNRSFRDELILNLTVTPVDDLPTISKITNQVTDEDVPINGIIFKADEGGGREEDIQVLEILAVSSNKMLIPDENIMINYSDIKSNQGSGVIDIVPKKNEFGLATITIQLFDGTMYNESTFTVFVNSVNDAPHAFEQTFTTNPDIAITSILRGLDIENGPLVFKIIRQGTKGIVKILSEQFGNFRYIPDENASDSDQFFFIVNDGKLDSAPAKITILIE